MSRQTTDAVKSKSHKAFGSSVTLMTASQHGMPAAYLISYRVPPTLPKIRVKIRQQCPVKSGLAKFLSERFEHYYHQFILHKSQHYLEIYVFYQYLFA